jgi:glycosyltransferase involved in cell wall biosynthesis
MSAQTPANPPHAMGDKPGACSGGDSQRRIVHIIAGLANGGAEAVLYRLISCTRDSWDVVVISLRDEGVYGDKLRALGVGVLCCRMHEAGQAVSGLMRLLRYLRRSRPDVVQTWMYHADLLGGLAARLLGFRTVLWGIRSLYGGRVSWSARACSRLCAPLSRTVPVAIVSCSARAADEHRQRGYAGDKLLVIPNGYDCGELRPDQVGGQLVRSEWGVLPSQFLIGMVARWDPLKDHANLFAALQPLMRTHEQVRCVLVGPGMVADNPALRDSLERWALGSKIVLAGPRADIAAVMNALDLHVLSSRSEGFPNVVAEAMACGTPCVVTDVGEAAEIVGDQGWCVPPGDPAALCGAMRAAMLTFGSGEGESLRAACRRRILETFNQDRMVTAYQDAWSRAIASRAPLSSAADEPPCAAGGRKPSR